MSEMNRRNITPPTKSNNFTITNARRSMKVWRSCVVSNGSIRVRNFFNLKTHAADTDVGHVYFAGTGDERVTDLNDLKPLPSLESHFNHQDTYAIYFNGLPLGHFKNVEGLYCTAQNHGIFENDEGFISLQDRAFKVYANDITTVYKSSNVMFEVLNVSEHERQTDDLLEDPMFQ